MSDKKQNSVDWLISCITEDQMVKTKSLNEWLEIFEQAKAMHKEEIVKAYNRDVINKKQNWFIENGERYYNLHYKGDQVEISGKEDQLGKTNPDYKFEDGV